MACALHFLCLSFCTGAALVLFLSLRVRMDVATERAAFRLFAVASLALALLAEFGAQYVAGLT